MLFVGRGQKPCRFLYRWNYSENTTAWSRWWIQSGVFARGFAALILLSARVILGFLFHWTERSVIWPQISRIHRNKSKRIEKDVTLTRWIYYVLGLKGKYKKERWCPDSESNQGHGDFQSPALPTELSGQRGALNRNLHISSTQFHVLLSGCLSLRQFVQFWTTIAENYITPISP